MDENIISLNIANIVTIGLIGIVMFTAAGMVAQWAKRGRG